MKIPEKVRFLLLSCLLVPLLLMTGGFSSAGSFSGTNKPFSPCLLLPGSGQNRLFILEATAKRLDLLSISSGELRKGPEFSQQPTGMALCLGKIYVTTEDGPGELYIIDTAALKLQKKVAAGAGSRSPVPIPSKGMLSICHTWKDEVGFYDIQSGKLLQTVPVLRQPYASVISRDERYLFVSNFITHQAANQDTVASAVSVINLESLEVEKNILLANGSNALHGMALSSDGTYVVISHNLGRFQVPTTQLEQGWMNTSALSVIRVDGLFYEGTVLLDDPDQGAAGSWGISCSNGRMVVAHSGTQDISVIDEAAFYKKLTGTPDRSGLSYDLSFMGPLRDRIPLHGNGPRSVCQIQDGIFVGMYFSDTINWIRPGQYDQQISFPLNNGFEQSSARLGEKYFHDASLCFQGWQACTGCHPLDARVDGLNWDLLNDGMGNPRNCKSLLLAHQTPPAMITGIRKDAETAVRAGFKYIQFAQVPEAYSQAVDAYLSNLNPVPSPFLEKGMLSKKARRGRVLFKALGCTECHSGSHYTDLKMHNFVSPTDSLGEQSWDTPTLIEVWRTGPWLHDGRCADMHDVFRKENHGLTEDLTEQELNDLVEYVLSL